MGSPIIPLFDRMPFFLLLLLLFAKIAEAGVVIRDFFPKYGSLKGGFYMRITGEGFSSPKDADSIYDTQKAYLGDIECPISAVMSSTTEIICIGAPSPIEQTVSVRALVITVGGGASWGKVSKKVRKTEHNWNYN